MLLYVLPVVALVLAFWIWHPMRVRGKRGFGLAVAATLVLALSPAVLLLLMRQTHVPYPTLAAWQPASGAVMATLAFAGLAAVARDALWLLLRLFRRRQCAAVLHDIRLTLAMVAAAVGLSVWGTLQGLAVPQVREQVVELARLPADLDGLRIVVLADLHASPINNAAHIEQIVERANAAGGDLIVLPGDLVDGDVASGRQNIAALARLHAPHGVWAAPGNHEYYSGYDEWAAEFRRLGLPYLENEVGMLNIRGHLVAISGVGDPAYAQPNNQGGQGVAPDIAAVVRAAREAGAQLHILLAHQPKLTPEAAQFGDIDLQISGHTHGGHILGMDRWLVAPANAGYVRGLYRVEPNAHAGTPETDPPRAAQAQPLQLFVSSGAGLWAGFALRIGIPSAIDVLVLKRPTSP